MPSAKEDIPSLPKTINKFVSSRETTAKFMIRLGGVHFVNLTMSSSLTDAFWIFWTAKLWTQQHRCVANAHLAMILLKMDFVPFLTLTVYKLERESVQDVEPISIWTILTSVSLILKVVPYMILEPKNVLNVWTCTYC